MEKHLRFLLLFVCIDVHQSDGNVVVSDASLSVPEHDNLKLYIMLKEQIAEQSIKTTEEMTKLRKQIEAMNTKISEQSIKTVEETSKLREQIAEQSIKTAEEMTKFTEKFYNKIEELDRTICDMKLDMQRLHPDNYLTVDTQTTAKPKNPASNNHAGGTTFVRWGRTECPSNISVPVYIGTVGGSHYTHSGAAVDYMCLPPDPQWNANKHFNGPHWGYMYGAEYERITDSSLFQLEVPCSVCLSTSYSATIMIPGRNQCYPGWQEAYHGELASGYFDHHAASEYVCLDDKPKGIGSKKNQDGILFYPVKAKCGSLPCPPYEHDRLLTCVVCLGGTHDL